MVPGIDLHGQAAREPGYNAPRGQGHLVGRAGARDALAVLHGAFHHRTDILPEGAAQSDVHELKAAADTQHRKPRLQGSEKESRFPAVPGLVLIGQAPGEARLVPWVGTHVPASGQKKPPDAAGEAFAGQGQVKFNPVHTAAGRTCGDAAFADQIPFGGPATGGPPERPYLLAFLGRGRRGALIEIPGVQPRGGQEGRYGTGQIYGVRIVEVQTGLGKGPAIIPVLGGAVGASDAYQRPGRQRQLLPGPARTARPSAPSIGPKRAGPTGPTRQESSRLPLRGNRA
jgi:hypothetical protein